MAGDPYKYSRQRMIEKHIKGRGIVDPRVLDVMSQVPRHIFVRENLRSQAYGDHALPTEQGQTISQPYIVARMTELLDVRSDHSVLEIGTGSGYQTIVLAYLARVVYSLERVPELARKAIERTRLFQLDNVKIQAFDGTVGWSEWAPYDRILVTAGAPELPKPLMDQLKPDGRLVIPEGPRNLQRLVVYDKLGETYERHEMEAVTFIPLVGRYGWEEGA